MTHTTLPSGIVLIVVLGGKSKDVALNSLHERSSRRSSLNRGSSRTCPLSCVQILCIVAVGREQTGFTILEYPEELFPTKNMTFKILAKNGLLFINDFRSDMLPCCMIIA